MSDVPSCPYSLLNSEALWVWSPPAGVSAVEKVVAPPERSAETGGGVSGDVVRPWLA